MTRWGKAAWVSSLIIVLCLATSFLTGSYMIRSKTSEVVIAGAQEIALLTADGVAIAASYWPGAGPRAPAVLLMHGNGGSREAVSANARWLSRQGFAVMAIDFRGHGRSAAASHSFGLNESHDARAAFDWLRRRQGGAPIAVVGISLGGASALIGDAGPLPADALILQAVYTELRPAIRNRIASITTDIPATLLEPLLSFQTRPRFGEWPSRFAPVKALRQYHGPLLVIGGAEDRFTPPAETRALFEAGGPSKQLWLAPQADHAAACLLSSDSYRAVLLKFLFGTIGRPIAGGASV